MTFNGCKTAVQIIWDWAWVWKSVTVDGAEVGFQLLNSDGTGNIGSVSLIDSIFINIKKAAIVVGPVSSEPGSGTTGLVLDNVNLGGHVVDSAGKELLASGYHQNVSCFASGISIGSRY